MVGFFNWSYAILSVFGTNDCRFGETGKLPNYSDCLRILGRRRGRGVLAGQPHPFRPCRNHREEWRPATIDVPTIDVPADVWEGWLSTIWWYWNSCNYDTKTDRASIWEPSQRMLNDRVSVASMCSGAFKSRDCLADSVFFEGLTSFPGSTSEVLLFQQIFFSWASAYIWSIVMDINEQMNY